MGTAVTNWQGQEKVFSNTLTELEYAAKKMLDYGIKPEPCIYYVFFRNNRQAKMYGAGCRGGSYQSYKGTNAAY